MLLTDSIVPVPNMNISLKLRTYSHYDSFDTKIALMTGKCHNHVSKMKINYLPDYLKQGMSSSSHKKNVNNQREGLRYH